LGPGALTSKPIDLLQLFLLERGRLMRLIGRIVGSRAVAEELAHDTFLRLWGRPVAAEDRSLLFRTAQNLAIDHMRARRVRAAYGAAVALSDIDEAPRPDATVAARQELDALRAALRSLPERTQRVFLLNRLDGMTYPGIAKALGVSVSTVEKDMIRALDLCRRWSAVHRAR